MRITNSTMTKNFLRNLSRNLEQMQKYQNQLSSGKEVSRPSDNPMLVSKIMSLDNYIMQNEQYNANIEDSIGWVETQDAAMNNLTSTLQRVRELMIYGANGALSDTDRLAIKDELSSQVKLMKDILNTNFDGRYIFGGQHTTTPPYEVVGDDLLKYKHEEDENNGNIAREISQGVMVELITDGSQITKLPDGIDLGLFIQKVIKALDEGDIEELSGSLLGDMDLHLDNVIRMRSKIGAIYNRLEASKSRNEAENINLKKLLSEREDIDIAEKYMEYSVMSTVYQASLSAGAKILQPSLLDYLR